VDPEICAVCIARVHLFWIIIIFFLFFCVVFVTSDFFMNMVQWRDVFDVVLFWIVDPSGARSDAVHLKLQVVF
jgi:hypothetical protein